MLYWFMRRGYKATLGEIMRSGEGWAYEFRARLVDAQRKFGYHWTCEKRTPRTENIYRIMPPDRNQMRFACILAAAFLFLSGCTWVDAYRVHRDYPIPCDDALSNCGKEPAR
jgi:hypothetical protein